MTLSALYSHELRLLSNVSDFRRRLRNMVNVAPTFRFVAIFMSISVLWLLSYSGGFSWVAVAATVALFIAFAVDVARLPAHRFMDVRLELPPLVGFSETAEGSYLVSSDWPVETVFKLVPNLSHNIAVIDSSSAEYPLSSSPASRPITVKGVTRGWSNVGETAITVRTRLGLAQRSVIYSHPGSITVIPAFGENNRFRLHAIQKQMRSSGHRALRQRGTSSSFRGLRDYSVGDDPRYIDWKASARRNKLITREFSVEQGQNILIAIDTGRLMTQQSHGTDGNRGIERLEYALSSALTLAEVAVASGDNIGLLVFNSSVQSFLQPAKGRRALLQFRDATTRASSALVESDYAAAFSMISAHQKRRALIVLFTDVIDPRSSRSIIAHTTYSLRRHLPLVIALKNEEIMDAATRLEPDYMYQAAAAEELIRERALALEQMKLAGIPVLDTLPSDMTSALISKFLEIKDRGLL